MIIDLGCPDKLYRYSERVFLERALDFGEFRLRPASEYKTRESDYARHDDELTRIRIVSPGGVNVTIVDTGEHMEPVGDITFSKNAGSNYFLLCFSKSWCESLFEDFKPSDSCLVIHDVNEFRNRIYRSIEISLPDWVGFDSAVTYGRESPHGVIFAKDISFLRQDEWRFAWRPFTPVFNLESFFIKIGSIRDIASIIDKN